MIVGRIRWWFFLQDDVPRTPESSKKSGSLSQSSLEGPAAEVWSPEVKRLLALRWAHRTWLLPSEAGPPNPRYTAPLPYSGWGKRHVLTQTDQLLTPPERTVSGKRAGHALPQPPVAVENLDVPLLDVANDWYGLEARRVCLSCQRDSMGPLFCGHCGAKYRLARKALKAARKRKEEMEERLDELQDGAGRRPSSAVHKAHMQRFEAFLKEGGCRNALSAEPADVVQYLISKDSSSKTTVHQRACRLYKTPGAATVEDGTCPKRLAATTVHSMIGTLQGAFRDIYGLYAPWDPQMATGNPVDSAFVRNYEKSVYKEQAAAGVKAAQAPVFDRKSFEQLMRGLFEEWLRLSKDGVTHKAFECLRYAMYFSLAWYTLDRGSDLTRFSMAQVQEVTVGDIKGWFISRLEGKTLVRPKNVHCSVPNDGSCFSPIRIWPLLEEAALELGINLNNGPLFVKVAPRKVGVSKRSGVSSLVVVAGKPTLSRQYFATKLTQLFKAQGWHGFTIHSFRASGAADAISRGVPLEVVMALGYWRSEEQAAHYALFRDIHSLAEGSAPLASGTGRGRCGRVDPGQQ